MIMAGVIELGVSLRRAATGPECVKTLDPVSIFKTDGIGA